MKCVILCVYTDIFLPTIFVNVKNGFKKEMVIHSTAASFRSNRRFKFAENKSNGCKSYHCHRVYLDLLLNGPLMCSAHDSAMLIGANRTR